MTKGREYKVSVRAVASRTARSGFRAALDAVLPPSCPVTGDRVNAPGLLSADGWRRLQFIDDPVCDRCGAPFAADYGDGAVCPACIAEEPGFARARAALVYDSESHRLLTSFKYGDRTELAPMFGAWLARAGAGFLTSSSIVAPTPLHRRRLFQRRYNQAAILASVVAKLSGAKLDHFLLSRTRPTERQASLSAEGRRRNVVGAFAVPDAARPRVLGASVVLIDDVLTTGSTLSACARTLYRAGAARVDALVVARVVKGGGEAL